MSTPPPECDKRTTQIDRGYDEKDLEILQKLIGGSAGSESRSDHGSFLHAKMRQLSANVG